MVAMPDIAEFTDPRLVAVYETINAYDNDAQPGFYAALAAELSAISIVDLGCGTGLITRALARHGYRMTGVDPSPAMLEVARQRPDGDRVRWVNGDATRLAASDADLAIMTGHVAQFFITDESWREALVALHGALRTGGRLAFETRNPEARQWEHWSHAEAFTVEDPVAGPVETWTEVTDVADGVVTYVNHYRFVTTGEELLSPSRLRFRTPGELRHSLVEAGFTIDCVYGDWDRRPADSTTPELVVVATANGTRCRAPGGGTSPGAMKGRRSRRSP